MKYFSTTVITLLLSACCSNLPKDISTEPLPNKIPPVEAQTIPVEKCAVQRHFVACRAKYAGEEQRLVDEIIVSAKDSKSAVVLYFHGGLSGQTYMRNTLGRQLMKTEFNQSNVKENLYPIFINYDVDPFQPSFSENVYEESEEELFNLALDEDSQEFLRNGGVENIDRDLNENFNLDNNLTDDSIHSRAAMAIKQLAGIKLTDDKTSITYEPTEDETQYLLKLATSDAVPAQFENGFAKPDLKYANNLRDLLKDKIKITDNLFIKKYQLRILRILARLALKNDHGRLPTIQEEYLDLVFEALGKDKSLARKHWDRVKLNSKQCFAEGSNGRALVDGLLNKGIKIHTLSHSAGSIPTAELIQYLANDKKTASIEKVVMVVPAISQSTFNNLVIPNQRVFKSLDVYALSEEAERKDTVGTSLVYSASLLYGVSSMGESSKMMDKMLLINQHMNPHRAPYKYKNFLCSVCENSHTTWEFFGLEKEPELNQTKKVNFKTYLPEISLSSHAATHGGTKLPWVSPDLARAILKGFDVPSVDTMEFKKPEKPKKDQLCK
jgi:hypothetical protein